MCKFQVATVHRLRRVLGTARHILVISALYYRYTNNFFFLILLLLNFYCQNSDCFWRAIKGRTLNYLWVSDSEGGHLYFEKRRFHEVLHWLHLWKVLGEIRARCWKTAHQTAKIKTATLAWVVERRVEGAPSSVEERQGGGEGWSFCVVGRVEGTCEEPSSCRGY